MKRTLIASAAIASLLVATSAFAADLPVYTKAPPVAVVYDWTGYYLGVNVGYSWGRGSTDGNVTGTQNVSVFRGTTPDPTRPPVNTVLAALPLSGRADVNGVIGGGQLGYNWQRGTWLFGLEGDIQGSGERGFSDVCTVAGCPAGSVAFNREYKLDWFGTARGRVGFLPAERILLYATGGLAYGGFSGSSTTQPQNIGTWASTRAGWTVGVGAEAALGNNWSVKFEYLYMDLGHVGGSSANTTSITSAANTPLTGLTTITTTNLAYVFNTKFTDNIVRVGLNYRFGGGAIVARY